jgi:branched-chain amino acid transport system permease protein
MSQGAAQDKGRGILNINRLLGTLLVMFFITAPWLLPIFTNDFWVAITAEIMIWSLLAASVNLLFGYTGLLSFARRFISASGCTAWQSA